MQLVFDYPAINELLPVFQPFHEPDTGYHERIQFRREYR